ncbi:MAG: WD40 repeat domain-containing protein, partial [Synechococcus sp.]
MADDIPDRLLKPLRDALEPSEGRVRLITLGTSPSPDPRRIQEEKLPPLSADSLRELLRCWYPAMAAELVSTVLNLADGNPGLARLAADALDRKLATTATLSQLDAIKRRREAIATHNKPLGRSDWSWPKAIDDAHYRSLKRQGFVGRGWLKEELQAWAGQEQGEQALVIVADFGVGKSAFLAEVIDTATAGRPVVAHHFCRADTSETLKPGRFVRSVAGQLALALPAYRDLLEEDDAKELRDRLDQAEMSFDQAVQAFEQAVLAPLRRIEPPPQPLLLLVDALDEAQDPSGLAAANGTTATIVSLLARRAMYLPSWLKVVATSRRRWDVLNPLKQAFWPKEIDAEQDDNLDDLRQYTEQRCQGTRLQERLSAARLTAKEVAEFLCSAKQSSGKFLYIVLVLRALESGEMPLASRAALEALPPGLDGFYKDTFQRRFPSPELYTAIEPVLGLLCVQQEPMGYSQLSAILEVSEDQIGLWLAPIEDLLRIQSVSTEEPPASPHDQWRVSFDHVSLEQWLTERSTGRLPGPRAGRFGVQRDVAADRIRNWALAEVEAHRAHTSPYLVRHLASHLPEPKRQAVHAELLGRFAWLEARLRLVGINALLADLTVVQQASSPQGSSGADFARLERALRHAAHVVGASDGRDGMQGHQHLASQLLARLREDAAGPITQNLRHQATEWIHNAGGLAPRSASLVGSGALLRTLPLRSGVLAVVPLPDGRVACGCSDGTIQLRDPVSGTCSAVFDGHQGGLVIALAVLPDGRLASGSSDTTIRLWELAPSAAGGGSVVFKGHQGSVMALVVLLDGRLASCSDDFTIRLWDLARSEAGGSSVVFEGHPGSVFGEWVMALAVLRDGRLASGSSDSTIRLWDLAHSETGGSSVVFKGHRGSVNALAVLPDGRLASGSTDSTIRLWDLANSETGGGSIDFKSHQRGVNALAVLPDGCLASGSDDSTIRLWDLEHSVADGGPVVFEGHRGSVNALAVLPDGRLASGSTDSTIRLWDLANSETGGGSID